MNVPRLAFLSHLVISLAVVGGAFFAWMNGVFQTIWAVDQSYMTSAIAALFVVTAAQIGWQAWNAEDATYHEDVDYDSRSITSWTIPKASADFGHLAALLSPALGMLGTTIGLSMQAKALAGGATSFVALATSLYSTGAGVAAYILITLLTFNLEQGIRQAGR